MELQQASLETAHILMPFVRRLHKNVARTSQLLKVSEDIMASDTKDKVTVAEDVLRGVVVFLHATLEDSLRSLATLYLPVSGEEHLNSIPLVGTAASSRPERFFLGKLAAHRGKTVDEVLEASVAAHLARSTYNDTTEIASLLRSLGLDPKNISVYFPALDQLIERRHHIVHRADLSDEDPEVPEHVRSIKREEVETWIEAVKELTTAMLAHIIGTEMNARGIK